MSDATPSDSPFPAPSMITSMKIPQKMPKAVSRLLLLLRVMVTQISCQLSRSNIFIRILKLQSVLPELPAVPAGIPAKRPAMIKTIVAADY